MNELNYLSGSQDVVHKLEEAFLFDFVVCENEGHSQSLESRHAVENLQVIQQVALIVGSKGGDDRGCDKERWWKV